MDAFFQLKKNGNAIAIFSVFAAEKVQLWQ